MGKKNISIKEIAKLSGVSVATVSRVINNNGRFSEETRKKVNAIIKEYGYTTNIAAKSLRTSQSKTIGLLVPNIDNNWFSHLVLEIERIFFEQNYSVFICNTSQDEKKEINYFKSLDAKMVDGIICIMGSEEVPTKYLNRDIPVVCIDREPKEISDAYYVESDHYDGGYQATSELIKQGCKDIVFLSRNKPTSANKQRFNGYLAALKENHIKYRDELNVHIDVNLHSYEGAKNAIDKVIKKGIKFDGIFATNDWRAYGALAALKNNHIQVPQQIKIIGFDDILISSMSIPSLSTIHQDTEKLAYTACHLLLQLMNKDISTEIQKKYVLPIKVVRRESTQ